MISLHLFQGKSINLLTSGLIFRSHNFQNGSNVLKNMQQKVKRVQKMLNENVILLTSTKDFLLYLNVTTQNFISTEFYHIGIKNRTADKQFIDRYTRQNFCLQCLRLVNRLYAIHKMQKIVNAMCYSR